MKPFQITLINGVILILLGLWGFFGSKDSSFTALIPVFAGTVLLFLTRGMKEHNRVFSHIAVGLTFVLLIALIKPLTGSLSRNDNAAIARVLVMMITCALALFIYIKSFIDARKQRNRIS